MVGLSLELVTRPTGAMSDTTASPSCGTVPLFITKPTRRLRAGRSMAAARPPRPMKSSLSILTTHFIPASSGLVTMSVSWFGMMCIFSSLSTRWVSVPKGAMPNSLPASIRASHTCSPYSAGKCSSQPVSPTNPMRSIRVGTPATLPSLARM